VVVESSNQNRHSNRSNEEEAEMCCSLALSVRARCEQEQRRRLPVLSTRTRQLQALGRDAGVEALKAAVRKNRQHVDRAAPNKSRRLEDMSSRRATKCKEWF
jgi:hypothetical protein